MSITRLQWREPTHNWRILFGDIDVVETMVYVAAAGATIAEAE